MVAAVAAFFLLEGTVRIVVITALLLTDVVEIALWLRWRNRRSMVGSEGMVGKTGTALTDVDPEGRVKVMGQIWKAWCPQGIEAGEALEVIGVEGLRLHVARR